jgi:hypothetical protein
MLQVPYRYQGRDAQAKAIAEARHWLDRLAQLTQFERVVLDGRGDGEQGRQAPPGAHQATFGARDQG